jgi:RNA polymerase sigma-70 factor, ECF subfamily
MAIENERVFELLAAIRRGSEAALRELYVAYSQSLYAFVLSRSRDAELAKEVVVDTMHEVWRHPDRFRGDDDARFGTWLIGIARHKMIDALRRKLRDPPNEPLDNEVLDEGTPPHVEQLAAQQIRDGVLKCMERLSPEHRECLHLVFYEDKSIAEIAEIQKAPENTVKTRLFHARRNMKNCLRLLTLSMA